jgi:RNA ligase (TIGR02306 family)
VPFCSSHNEFFLLFLLLSMFTSRLTNFKLHFFQNRRSFSDLSTKMVDTTRKLATIVKIVNLHPIKGKDRIELAEIKGWKCIVKKGEFYVGDLGVYCAIDSVPDFEDPNFTFLKEKSNRIKTIKMGGVLSQGLLGPLQWLTSRGYDVSALNEGDDVSESMGVVKYVADEEKGQYQQQSGPRQPTFPAFVPKTDATRLQDDPSGYFSVIAEQEIVVTRKEDGCSCTFLVKDGEFKLCGRNVIWEERDNNCGHYYSVAESLQIREKMTALGRDLAIQGEVIGPKVNGNRLRLTELYFRVFDIFDIDSQSYLLYDEVSALCGQLGLSQVPLIFRGPYCELFTAIKIPDSAVETIDKFLAVADAQEYVKGVTAEGIVVKTNTLQADGQRTVFKVISNKYLLKHDL